MNQPVSFTLLPPSALRPVLPTLPAMPSAVSAPDTGRFSRVSSLLGIQDQVQVSSPSASAGLLNPLSLFKKPVQSAPAVQAPVAIAPAKPAVGLSELRYQSSVQKLKSMPPSELKTLGQEDKKAFFEALLPAAIESEKQYGVPAEVTLAQAALESAWARSPIGGYNIFGIKGSGSAGTVNVQTREFYNGRYVTIRDNFARYSNFHDAVISHGKLFHNGYYDKAVNQYAKDKNPLRFLDNIQGIYATDPKYSQKIKSIIEDYGLSDMVNRAGMV
ncbi:hypothetical protein COW36_21925 [bacterium (Candidatus Blackallbacteria) CG17_big_fil_post_rev_8_21_14_2_50_48_46]|uniref:Mannosyl-glycoprotein endo-beta-N-acetylglucosamidase-like domain-containing protein n=1 Tax=bacterium (Candidatus Blackallbacteria) CG17_big_fil_post_rev_8_21_14_2_50_48_46 TaxID=2014261 RepID=A0A2M7FY74_9BACT|nr:MAG: hypothetical protein COW64_13355 [bacterium (Candidatus Blackallbacteria) CG18_big_fil_WC_8_21_14_2_50_49_26]PIW14277.1 MAG: hypothetical protein COW36_21925 [bacterium (Candidatus Blackallbacteria) CG17_big_fil_post_rev_8_21_14_2_50_48_46]PIW45546.1 MAG: hypothetical protein COW20_19530 [bacterium (Candidatus Blackallbacteria) CG13_big_fil_rev_8_21_14_2_50_49_14]